MNNPNISPGGRLAHAPASDHRLVHTEPHVRTLHEATGFAGQPANDTVRPVRRVGIMGANGMGIGIATGLLDADIPVTVFDKQDALDQGLALLRTRVGEAVATGVLSASQGDRRLALFSATARFHHLKDCDLVIDVMEVEFATREKFFRWLDEIGKADAILVARLARPGVDTIARVTRRPADVLGLSFPHPGEAGDKPSLVRGKQTSAEAYATTAGLLAAIGKLASD